MKIEWNKVTWYSSLFAVILYLAVFYIGFYFGTEYAKVTNLEAIMTTR